MKDARTPKNDLENIMPLLIGIWRRFHKLQGPHDRLQTREFRSVVEAVNIMHSENATTDLFSQPQFLGAYLLYSFVLHYQMGLSLIGELPRKPSRVLDLCSGPGAFAFAALKHGADEVVSIDRNPTALKLAAEVCGRYGFPLTTRNHNVLHFPYPVDRKFDLIICGFCLEELFTESESMMSWIKTLTSILSNEGHLLFVESSQPQSNQRFLALRDQCLHEGYPILAPCVWKGNCPALASNQVCYAQRDFEKPYLIKEIQRAANINLSSLKMSYLLLGHPQSSWPKLPQKSLYRVISPPTDSHFGKRFHLCGTDGKKDIGSHEKEHPKEARAFDFLKRGELISISSARARGDHLDIVPGTCIQIEAALGKPIPIDESLDS